MAITPEEYTATHNTPRQRIVDRYIKAFDTALQRPGGQCVSKPKFWQIGYSRFSAIITVCSASCWDDLPTPVESQAIEDTYKAAGWEHAEIGFSHWFDGWTVELKLCKGKSEDRPVQV